MYKVNYYTLALIKHNGVFDVGNIKQYSDIFYTDGNITDIPQLLVQSIAKIKGENKYKPIITNIELIDGHM